MQLNITQLPAFLNGPYQKVAAESARQLFDEQPDGSFRIKPYQAYPGRRQARFNEDIINSHQRMGNINGGADNLRRASDVLGDVKYSLPQNYQEYMNPYTSEVVRKISDEGNRNFKESTLPALEAAFVGLGAHGGMKHRELASRAARDMQGSVLDRQAQAMERNYMQAAQNFNSDQGRKILGAQGLEGQATREFGRDLLGIEFLRNRGQEKMSQQQRGMDLSHQDFLRQMNYPMDQIGKFSQSIQGIPIQPYANQGSYSQGYDQLPPQPNQMANFARMAGNMMMASSFPGGGGQGSGNGFG